MSVFTPVTPAALSHWLQHYDLGELLALEGIAEGVQNSNFFVTTSTRRLVLTVFEHIEVATLEDYLALMAHLSAHGIACPAPVRQRHGAWLGTLAGKPAALFSRLSGRPQLSPETAHCQAVGQALAQLHLAGRDFRALAPHPRGPEWWTAAAARVRPFLDRQATQCLDRELALQATAWPPLPSGAIHADLFRDNVLFADTSLTGLLDFYFAGHGPWLFDLAVTVNDWCLSHAGDQDSAFALDPGRTTALLTAYAAVRPLSDTEAACWPRMLRAAALRFWLSRLEDYHLPRAGETVTVRDPHAYGQLLEQRARTPAPPWLARMA